MTAISRRLPPLLLAYGVVLLAGCGAHGDDRTSPAAAPTSTLTPTTVQASGELASADTVLLGPPIVQRTWQHKITFMAPEGSTVAAGEPVLGFEASKQQQELKVKQGELATAKQKLDNTVMADAAQTEELKLKWAEAEMKLDKASRKLQQSGQYLANNELKKLQLDRELAADQLSEATALRDHHQRAAAARKAIASAELARLDADVQRLRQEIGRMTVAAPKAGLVVYKTDWEGNKLGEGDTIFVGQSVLEIPSLERMVVKAEVLEVDAGRVRVGQPVRIVLDAQADREFFGKVASLGQVFRSKSHKDPAVVFDAVITIDAADAAIMRPGMAVRLRIETATVDT